jgi:hypothetical protein
VRGRKPLSLKDNRLKVTGLTARESHCEKTVTRPFANGAISGLSAVDDIGKLALKQGQRVV